MLPFFFTDFIEALKYEKMDYSIDGMERLIRSHGQTLHDIYVLRTGMPERIPDVVVWAGRYYIYFFYSELVFLCNWVVYLFLHQAQGLVPF